MVSFFFNDTATTEIYTLSLHDALPILRPVLVIVVQVRRHQPFEMPLIQDNHVVQQVASGTSHPALSDTVLPRTAKGRANWLAPHVPHSRNDIGAKLCVSIE